MATVTFPKGSFYSLSPPNLLHQSLTAFSLVGVKGNNILKEIIDFLIIKNMFCIQLLKCRTLSYRVLSQSDDYHHTEAGHLKIMLLSYR